MPKPINHVVRRPGRKPGDPEIDIPVAEDLATVPGAPQKPDDVAFYSREYPLETQNIEKSADREWAWTVYTEAVAAYRKGHNERSKPIVEAAEVTADIAPTGIPEPGCQVTKDIRTKARELGFGEVGFTRLDRKYVYVLALHFHLPKSIF